MRNLLFIPNGILKPQEKNKRKTLTNQSGEFGGIIIPQGKLANEEAEQKRKREQLAEKLRKGEKVKISPTGNVTENSKESGGITIPQGKLANEEAEQKRKREQLAEKLRKGEKVKISPTGNVTENSKESGGIIIPQGKLALNQWYQEDKELLHGEIEAMNKAFPYFELQKLDDGRLAWMGNLQIGILGNNVWKVAAIYNNNHPKAIMGSSVKVFLIEPNIEDLIEDLGWSPAHLLRSNEGLYLCTAEADNIRVDNVVTSAASVLAWAVKWLMAFELVLTGDLSKEKFNEHGGI